MKRGEILDALNAKLNLGQSDSNLELIFRDGSAIIRKSSGNPTRLMKQYQKHLNLDPDLIYPLHAPRIVSPFNGHSYEMEFVHGLPFGFALNRLRLDQVKEVAIVVSDYFNSILVTSKTGLDQNLDLSQKIHSLASSALVNKFQFGKDSIELLRKHSQNIQLLSGWNHGDFSYDNILIRSNSGPIKVITLDFLDSPFESPLIDLGRFWLDSNFGWWDFDNNKSATWSLNNQLLVSEVLRVAQRHGISVGTMEYFALFACLRIVPYLKNPHRISFIRSAMKELIAGSSKWQF